MKEIKSIEDISFLLTKWNVRDFSQYGCVYTNERGSLIQFNYHSGMLKESGWNFFERVSRGLIMDKITGEVVARPFEKFFNYGEIFPGENDKPIEITEKLDGSLGILYQDEFRDWKIATRGSFESDQGKWATEYFHKHYSRIEIPTNTTLLFEIIYPENQIVVNYYGFEGLILIGAIHKQTGKDFLISRVGNTFGFDHVVESHRVMSIKETLNFIERRKNTEGIVMRFESGLRLKFKSSEYRELHKFLGSILNRKYIKSLLLNRESIDAVLSSVPEHYHDDVMAMWNVLYDEALTVQKRAEDAFSNAPKTDRKTYALWVMENAKDISPIMFNMLDGKDPWPEIIKVIN